MFAKCRHLFYFCPIPRYFRAVKFTRLLLRLLFFVGFTAQIVAQIWLLNLFAGQDMRRSMRIRRRWARRLLSGIGVVINRIGSPPGFPCLMVCNHRSYLDPILMLCDVDGYPVAKAELADWPLIGKGAKMAGILYLKREHHGSRSAILRKILEKIEAGYPVIIFPEGTTSSLDGTLPFKKGGFKLAVQNKIPVVPVAVQFHDKRDYWVGKASFLSHARQRFQEPKIYVDVHYGPTMASDSPDILIQDAKGWIDAVLANKQRTTK